ncbi:MAG: asparagine synthetase B family protein [Candidatus Zhuqueibacterota bacterium]
MNSFIGHFDRHRDVAGSVNQPDAFSQSRGNILANNCCFANKDSAELFFWGEIYNAPDLEKALASPGVPTEKLLLRLFLTKGLDGFKQVDGKFLVIISDGSSMYVLRDKNGIGPRFFFTNEYFASSMDELQAFQSFSPKIDMDAASSFLYGCFVISPGTIFQGVRKLSPGGVLIYRDKTITVDSLFDYSDFNQQKMAISEDEAAEQYISLLHRAIQRRIKDHSTVGVLLSGGYDSGGVIAALRDVYGGKIKSYSIGFRDNPWSELPFAKKMAETFDAEFNAYLLDGSEIDYLPEIVRHFGEPFAEQGFFINYMAMKSVDPTLPVVMGGDGNDQLFGTASQQIALHFLGRKYGFQLVQRMAQSLSHLSFFQQDNVLFRFRFHNRAILDVLDRENFGFSQQHIGQLLNLKMKDDANGWRKYHNFDELYNLRNFYIDIRTIANEAILYKAARMSELHGVPLTFPYMDLEMYRFLTRLPRQLKTKGSLKELMQGRGVSKFLLKKTVKSKLPAEVSGRKKQGGFAPLGVMFADNALRHKLFQYIRESEAARAMFNPKFLNAFFEAFDASSDKGSYWFWFDQIRGNQLLNLLLLTLWWDIFIERDFRKQFSDYLE